MLKILFFLFSILPADNAQSVSRCKTVVATKQTHPCLTTVRLVPNYQLARRDTAVIVGNPSKRSSTPLKSNLVATDSIAGSEHPDRNSTTKTNQAQSTPPNHSAIKKIKRQQFVHTH